MTDTRRMFTGLVGGAVAGLALARLTPDVADRVAAVAEPLGMLWLNALQMTVLPLVVSLLIVGVAQAADIAATGRIARRALAWILALSTRAAILAAVLAPLVLAAVPKSTGLAAAVDGAAASQPVDGPAAALPAQLVAASTQSSLASLPAMMESARRLGYPAAVCGLVLPLAVSLFRITSPAQYVAVASFIAWANGMELAAGRLSLAILMSVVISLGSVGLPGQASFMGTVLPVVQSAGLPIEPLGLLLAVDLVPDVFATVGNVTGDLALTSRITRAER